MARGRPVGSKSVKVGRDAAVVMHVAHQLYMTSADGKPMALRDGTNAIGRRTKPVPPSAYAAAQETLRLEGIHLGVDSIESIYKKNKAAFFGNRNLNASFRRWTLQLRQMTTLSHSTGDHQFLAHDPERPDDGNCSMLRLANPGPSN